MKAKLFLVVVLFVLAQPIQAQIKDLLPIKVGIGAVAGVPVADATDFFNSVFGVDLQGEFYVIPSFALTLSAGYVEFSKKSGVTGNSGLIPVLGGVKYFFSDKVYGSAQAGLSVAASGDAGSTFTFAPAIGYKLSNRFDLSLKYQSATKDGWNDAFLGLRVGLSF